jgi:hypothetical protein
MNLIKKQFLKIKNFLNEKKISIEHILNFLAFFIGLLSYYFKYYILTFYTLLHLTISLAQYLSKGFNQRVLNYHQDQITIRNHYLEDFKIFYYLIFSIRIITILFYLYFFSLDPKVSHDLSNLFYCITYTFIIAELVDTAISLYIIIYKNHPVIETAANICAKCFKGLVPLGAFHMSCNVPIIKPNEVSNFYQTYSPLGQGYGVWSSCQNMQIDYIKTRIGGEFDYTKVIDSNKMIDPNKLEQYVNSHPRLSPAIFNSFGPKK